MSTLLVLSFAASHALGLQETASQLESLTLLPTEAGLVAVLTADRPQRLRAAADAE